MNEPVQLSQLLFTALGFLALLVGQWVAANRELASAKKSIEYQQKQIDEIKTANGALKGTIDQIKENVADMRGDVKVILSRIGQTA